MACTRSTALARARPSSSRSSPWWHCRSRSPSRSSTLRSNKLVRRTAGRTQQRRSLPRSRWEGSSFWSVKLGSLWPRQVACRPLRTHDPWSAGRSRRMTRRGGVRFETYGAGVQRRDGSPVCGVCRPEVCLAWAASRQRDDLESRRADCISLSHSPASPAYKPTWHIQKSVLPRAAERQARARVGGRRVFYFSRVSVFFSYRLFLVSIDASHLLRSRAGRRSHLRPVADTVAAAADTPSRQ